MLQCLDWFSFTWPLNHRLKERDAAGCVLREGGKILGKCHQQDHPNKRLGSYKWNAYTIDFTLVWVTEVGRNRQYLVDEAHTTKKIYTLRDISNILTHKSNIEGRNWLYMIIYMYHIIWKDICGYIFGYMTKFQMHCFGHGTLGICILANRKTTSPILSLPVAMAAGLEVTNVVLCVWCCTILHFHLDMHWSFHTLGFYHSWFEPTSVEAACGRA